MATSFKLILPADRVERIQYVRRMFPQAKGRNLLDIWPGGRREAMQRLAQVDAANYARNRNFINGAVTKLSPYLRHGCITLKEAVNTVYKQSGKQSERLITELAYKDFWRQNWYRHGNAIYSEMEAPKVALGDKNLPMYIHQGITGLPCMDEVVRDLANEGYVHNHARMWFAAFVVHWLKVDWRKAADWFELQLLDGDRASNHLSWQWVASSFSSKPYYFNRENLARFTGEKYCAKCQITCPFDDTYEGLQNKIFNLDAPSQPKTYPVSMPEKAPLSSHSTVSVYIHDEMLSPTNPLMNLAMPKIFVFDEILYGNWPLKRLQFMADCLSEMPNVEIWLGDTREVLREAGVGQVISQNTPNLQVKALVSPFNPIWQDEEKLTDVELSLKRLARFTRYWEKVGPALMTDLASH
jgi:deoxyribodipyrimidine photo-lyase